MNLKITGVVAICFIIGVSLLYLVNEWSDSNFDGEKQKLNWYSETAEIPNKGFLLGNSRFYVLNELIISDFLLKNEKNLIIYDLAMGAKLPDYWKGHLKGIVTSKPEIVIIGIDPGDFNRKEDISENNSFSFLSIPRHLENSRSFLGEKLQDFNFLNLDISNLKNPKLSSLKLIKLIETEVPDENLNRIPTQPFFSGGQYLSHIMDEKEIEERDQRYTTNIIENNKQELALIQIIQNLQKHDINIILITTPRHQVFLQNWDPDDKKEWGDLLDRIEKKTNAKIYNLQSEFSDLNIFADLDHVTTLPEGNIFSEEVAKIILLEFEN